ncbi:glycosyltransferase family 39 protein [Streptomyces sp. NPDC050147]|uniref:glycosyltransferase family 39 protein n=1 Tax=Streptomyces sp. NPDC050147 TaxID=3155513 RepID=UPI00342B7490
MPAPASAPPSPPAAPDARWVRPALIGLLAAVALAYLWNLSASHYANPFYSAAAQAGSENWKAFLFGSSDAANAITVDKPPAALWPMALSVRLFGLGTLQILLPQVLMAVATAAVLYAAVRRRFTAPAGLIAIAVFATAPVAALMFRFNNPDAPLALLMTLTVYCVLRAMEEARTKWLLLAGAAVGLAFLTKSLQAFLILPPLALLYAVCAPTPLPRRLGQLVLAALTVLVCGGWWVALVELWPAATRPYIGGSHHNSFMELTFGYNGLGRLNGDDAGNAGGTWSSGTTGISRLLSTSNGGQITWLLPAALILLTAALLATRRAARTDTTRAAYVAWGSALVTTAATFSFMQGMFHAYYTVALAPYIAALIGMGTTTLWQHRNQKSATTTLALTLALTAIWSHTLLTRTSGYLPWLRWTILATGLTAALALPLAKQLTQRNRQSTGHQPGQQPGQRTEQQLEQQNGQRNGQQPGQPTGQRLGHQLALGAAALGLAASLAGPLAYTVTTLRDSHTGSIVAAGPPTPDATSPADTGEPDTASSPADTGEAGGTSGPGAQSGPAGTGEAGDRNAPGSAESDPLGTGAAIPAGDPDDTGGTPQPPGKADTPQPDSQTQTQAPSSGDIDALLNGITVSDNVKATLLTNADDYTWPAATIGAQIAASYQLSTQRPIMAIGGFVGTDPSPTLTQFQQHVTENKIHYLIADSQGAAPHGTSTHIWKWVTTHFQKTTIDGTTLYDLTQPTTTRHRHQQP